MDELSVKIKIADREYAMKVKNALEEERVAGRWKDHQWKIKQYRDKFGIDDKQDLLPWCLRLRSR